MMRILQALSRPWLGPIIRQRAVCRALLVFICLLALTVGLAGGLWPCYFTQLTGLPCPGCGMTRAASAWMRGDISAALRLHPFSPLLIIIGILISAGALLPTLRAAALADQVTHIEQKSRSTAIVIGLLTLFSLLRLFGYGYPQPT